MNILYSSTSYPPAVGGAQLHLHALAREIQSLGNRVHVVTHTSRNRRDWLRLSTVLCDSPRTYAQEGINVSQLGYTPACRLQMAPWAIGYYLWMGAAVRRIAALIAAQLPDLPWQPSLVHCSRIGREFLAQTMLDFARRQRIPFVLTPNHHPRWHGPLYREYDRIYRSADAVFALTGAEKELLIRQKGLREEQIHVTGIGPLLSDRFSAEQFRSKYGIHGPFVLYLGQQLKYKGIGVLLEAAERVWQRFPDVRFVVIGPESSYSHKLFARFRDQRVRNLGRVDLETKTSALAACELLCLPSTQESFGGVFVEAWSLGKPVIGGRIPSIASVIDAGQDGLLSSPSPDELATAITRLLSDPAWCAAMGEAGRQKAALKYSWSRIGQATAAVYASLL